MGELAVEVMRDLWGELRDEAPAALQPPLMPGNAGSNELVPENPLAASKLHRAATIQAKAK